MPDDSRSRRLELHDEALSAAHPARAPRRARRRTRRGRRRRRSRAPAARRRRRARGGRGGPRTRRSSGSPRGHAERLAGVGLGAASQGVGELGERRERTAQRDEIARRGAVEGELDREPLDVAHLVEPLAQLAPRAGVPREELDRVVTAPDLGDARERREEPPAEQARAGRGLRRVDLSEERAALGAVDRAGRARGAPASPRRARACRPARRRRGATPAAGLPASHASRGRDAPGRRAPRRSGRARRLRLASPELRRRGRVRASRVVEGRRRAPARRRGRRAPPRAA